MSDKDQLAHAIAAEVCRIHRTTQKPLTARQHDTLEFIVRYRSEHGYSPTFQEIGDEFGIAKVSVLGHIEELQRKGWIVRLPHFARSIKVVDGGDPSTDRLVELAKQYATAEG